MIKNTLYVLSMFCLILSIYFAYEWYQAEPNNREILPTILSSVSALISALAAFRQKQSNNLKIESIDNSDLDITQLLNTDISVKKVKGRSIIKINKSDSNRDN